MKRKYTQNQIERARKEYNRWNRFHTLADYDVETIGINEAAQRRDFHNSIIEKIRNNDYDTIKEWKYICLNEEWEKDHKKALRKEKLQANKSASAEVLEPVKNLRKIGEFGRWLNTSGNPYRKQHFNKKYTAEAVNEFLNTL